MNKILSQEASQATAARPRDHLPQHSSKLRGAAGYRHDMRHPGLTQVRLVWQPSDFGLLLESFVYNELRKQATWINEPLHFSSTRIKIK